LSNSPSDRTSLPLVNGSSNGLRAAILVHGFDDGLRGAMLVYGFHDGLRATMLRDGFDNGLRDTMLVERPVGSLIGFAGRRLSQRFACLKARRMGRRIARRFRSSYLIGFRTGIVVE